VGWGAHIIEQHDGNRLIRPNHIYVGQEHRPFVRLDDRGWPRRCFINGKPAGRKLGRFFLWRF